MEKSYEELQRENEELAAKLAFLRQILGITAHDLRGSTAVLAGIEDRLDKDIIALAKETSQERRMERLYGIRSQINIIGSAGRDAVDHTELLSLEGITPEEIKQNGRKFKVVKSVKNTYKTLRHKLVRRGLSIVLEYPNELQDYEVHTSPSAIKCITANLIRNSIQYATSESVIKSILYTNDSNLIFELENMVTKPIDTELITQIFQRGFRLEATDPTIIIGNEGIGLYWVQEIIKQGYKGNIEVTSDKRFQITEERTRGYEKKVYGTPYIPSYKQFPSFHTKVSIPLEALAAPIKKSAITIEDLAAQSSDF